mmetsp:Transcript_1144/g.2477  ORF Transcript_1144/g.2477 Transcript_1144/m.2477 type:complete len:295 (-) Transcript_1144:475-1359(-)|eukprot:CAMPEP_0173416246 /NCGR_PEP_ID=MMETSP1356-20130122/85291_1 /TAXON_ID=77927 ORGANISM="Hemiselmis virescens, Strain PCC157" /NCGR_SAMPLE_ID=MMETSP1356 /ASSEMBLY_ACC=CAM_ASM_000847 /LENGTH=294 /DNA_ID=CAMNT_0014378551 /DNA_START=53 /DNA_END=937 /DNA_ORIENTATION=-
MEGTAKLSFFERLVSSNNPNPGKFEDIGAEARKVFQVDTFEGIKAEYQRGLSNSFGVSHTIHLSPGADQPSSYEFGANYSQGKHLLVSRTAATGDVQAQYLCSVTPNLSVKAQGQLTSTPHQSNGMVNLDYKGSDWYGSLKMGSFAQWGLSYIQSVSQNLSLGVDLTYLGRLPYGQPPMCVSTAAVRYADDNVAGVFQYSSNNRVQASYVRRIKDYATFATELSVDLESRESVCAMGYEYTGPAGTLKTNISTDKKITTLLEKPLSELSAVSCSAELDHKTGTCKYGIGIQFLQ